MGECKLVPPGFLFPINVTNIPQGPRLETDILHCLIFLKYSSQPSHPCYKALKTFFFFHKQPYHPNLTLQSNLALSAFHPNQITISSKHTMASHFPGSY